VKDLGHDLEIDERRMKQKAVGGNKGARIASLETQGRIGKTF
jgi:hypothetical protein